MVLVWPPHYFQGGDGGNRQSLTSQPAASAVSVFQSALREKTHLPARFGEGVKRRRKEGAKCQIKLFWDYLRCRSGRDLWSSCMGIADLSEPCIQIVAG